jgi:hypothetical protein
MDFIGGGLKSRLHFTTEPTVTERHHCHEFGISPGGERAIFLQGSLAEKEKGHID